MNFTNTNPGWNLLSTTTQQTWSEAMASWGISTSTVYKYIYELNNAPISASTTFQLTADNWTGTDISAYPTFLLNPMKAYWINIQNLIVDIILSGIGGELNKSIVTAQLPSTSLQSNVIVQGYISIGANAFSGATNLKSIIIPASVTFIDKTAFTGCSGLITVIFESVTNLLSLKLLIQNTSQSFFGTTVIVLPTKAAVSSALLTANQAVITAQQQAYNYNYMGNNEFFQAQIDLSNAQTLVTTLTAAQSFAV